MSTSYFLAITSKITSLIFFLSSPASIRETLSQAEIAKVQSLKNTLSNAQEAAAAAEVIEGKLPWKILPSIGVSEANQNIFSKSQLEETYLSVNFEMSFLL